MPKGDPLLRQGRKSVQPDIFIVFIGSTDWLESYMTLDQVKVFLAVAEREHVTRAAEALNLTQSAVSGAIQALERRHKVILFNRIGRRVELTREGRLFLEHANTLIRAANAAEASLAGLRGLERGVVSIHASQTTGSYWLPQRLVRFHERHPNIEIKLSVGNTGQVARAVRSGDAEIGYVEGVVDYPEIKAEEVDVDKLVIVVGATHPWARLARIKRDQIHETNWVLRERGSGTRAVFEEALRRLKINSGDLKVSLELPSNESVRAAVEAGAGATAISHAVVDFSLRLKTLHAVAFAPVQRPFVLLSHRERTPSNAVRAFLECDFRK
jgi:DNA-binding transcriptional LysR family regulator